VARRLVQKALLVVVVLAMLAVGTSAQADPTTVLSKTVSPRPAKVGKPFTYTLKETNKTKNPVTVNVTDHLPSNVTFASWGPFFGKGLLDGSSCSSSGAAGSTVSCTFNIKANKSGGIKFQVSTPDMGEVTNTATDDQGNQDSATVQVK
jgi:uncharacterized repeat protein (TIGR01451 family)